MMKRNVSEILNNAHELLKSHKIGSQEYPGAPYVVDKETVNILSDLIEALEERASKWELEQPDSFDVLMEVWNEIFNVVPYDTPDVTAASVLDYLHSFDYSENVLSIVSEHWEVDNETIMNCLEKLKTEEL